MPSSEACDGRELQGGQREINRGKNAAKRYDGAWSEIEYPPGMERTKNLGGVKGDVIGAGQMKLRLLATNFKVETT